MSSAGAGLAVVTGEAPAAVLLVDLATREVVYANPVAQQLAPGVHLPVPVDAWSDAAVLRDVDGEELSETRHPLSLVARSTPVAGQAVSAARATEMGRTREPLWVVALPMVDAPQLEGHALVVLLPMHERAAAEAAAVAAAQEADLRDRAVVATGMAFTVADARAGDLPLIWVNPAFSATTGYSFEEAVGRNCRFLQGPKTDRDSVRVIRRAVDAGEPLTVVLLNYRKDGTAFWNQVSMSPIHGADGELTHYVGIQTDVTGRVRADEERDLALAAEQRARQEAENAHAQLSLLAEATSQLAASLDVAECRERLAALVVPALGDWVLVASSDERGGLEETTSRHRDGSLPRDVDRDVEVLARARASGTLERAMSAGALTRRSTGTTTAAEQRQASRDWTTDPAVLELRDALGVGSLLLVPLPGRHGTRDVMLLARAAGSTSHSDDDLVVATDLGRRAGLILDNARAYQNEHRIAEALQRSLLPQLPVIPGVTAAARYAASASGAAVGGDFYDLIALPGGAVALAAGDVMGHDVMAAAAMGHLRGLLRACAFDTDQPSPPGDRRRRRTQDPGDVLDRVDQLVEGLGIATLATITYARLEQREDGSWLARYASAGHPPLLVRHPDGSVEDLDDAPGLMLGVQPTTRPTATRALAAGSTVLAYTDGLIERRDADLDEGLARLRAALAGGPVDVEQLCDHVLERFGDTDDDVALLAVRLGDRPRPTLVVVIADPVIRPLRADDRAAWQPLWEGYLDFYRQDLPAQTTETAFGRLCLGGDALFGLVACDGDDRPVGFSHALLHSSTWAPGGVCYLEDLFVAPDARGGRTARALVEATADEARGRGAGTLYWRTQAFNGRARSLYDQVGHLSSDVMYERQLTG